MSEELERPWRYRVLFTRIILVDASGWDIARAWIEAFFEAYFFRSFLWTFSSLDILVCHRGEAGLIFFLLLQQHCIIVLLWVPMGLTLQLRVQWQLRVQNVTLIARWPAANGCCKMMIMTARSFMWFDTVGTKRRERWGSTGSGWSHWLLVRRHVVINRRKKEESSSIFAFFLWRVLKCRIELFVRMKVESEPFHRRRRSLTAGNSLESEKLP